MKRRDFLTTFLPASALLAAACSKQKRSYKLGVCDWSMRLTGKPEIMDVAKSVGLNGVQISSTSSKPTLPYFTDAQIDAYLNKSRETGVEVCSIATTCMNPKPFYSADGAVEYLISAIAAAEKLSCKNILLPFYGPANMLVKGTTKMDERHFEPLVERLKKIAPYAEKAGVNISMENSISAEDDLRIIKAVGSKNVSVYYDTMNVEYYGHPSSPACLRALKGHVGQIHIKSDKFFLDTGEGRPANMQDCYQAILDIDYDGWLVFEFHGFKPSKELTLLDLLKRNVASVKNSILFK